MTADLGQRESLVAGARRVSSVIEAHADWAEEHARLHETAVAALVTARVPRLYLPKRLGGDEVDPATCAYVTEALADADSAAAWHVMVYNAARLMASAWPAEMVERLWADNPDTMVAASGHTPFKADRVDGGYRISGRNAFVSGCHHADYIMSPVLVDGQMHHAAIARDVCQIEDNWDTLGMRGSGSNDVTVQDAFIPEELVAKQAAEPTHNHYYEGQLYNCPSRVVFATYVPVALSLARRALDELELLAANKVPYASDAKLKTRVQAQSHYSRGLGKYRATRAYFYGALEDVWVRAGRGEAFSDRDRADLYLAGTYTLQTCAEVVRHVADAAGTSVLERGRPLERIARDMETLRHHGFANESRFASIAQVLWDAPLDYPLILR